MMIGLFTASQSLVGIGALLFSAVLLFQIVTLPVEFDATARAKKLVVAYGIISERERVGMDRVFNAAALTYVAAVVSTLLTLLYFSMGASFLGGGGTTSGACPLPVAPADAGGAQRSVAKTPATACVSAPPIDRQRLSAPRPPGWPIAPGSTRARDAARESAHRSRLAHWPRSTAAVDLLAVPVGHSRRGETAWRPQAWHAPGAVGSALSALVCPRWLWSTKVISGISRLASHV